jgi:small subunit ribosomal protein S8
MTDPIADMLTRIRNAIAAKHSRVDIPASKLKLEIARILKEEGYVNNFVIKGEGLKRTIRIFLRYDARGTLVDYVSKKSLYSWATCLRRFE